MESLLIFILDLFGTAVFAVTGAVKGVRHKLDIFGVTVLACCVGVGGGMVRDCIIGTTPVAALRNEQYILICIATGIAVFYTAKYWMRYRDIIQFGDAVGLGVFTALGAQKGFACDLSFTGIVLCGVFTAIGGGIIRDLLLQDHGVYFMEYPEVILICICLAVFVFYFRGLFRHTGQVLFFADALSVALFALAGANKAFACGEGFVMVVILGALTSVGGGALRDISVGETPGVFQRSNFYAVAGFGGAFVFAAMAFAKAPLVLAAAACVFTVVFLRYLSVYYDWKTSDEADLTPKVARGARTAKHFCAELFRRATLHRKKEPATRASWFRHRKD